MSSYAVPLSQAGPDALLAAMTPIAADQGWEALFAVVFERSANPILMLDDQRRILDANRPTLELLGYTRGGLIGRPHSLVIAPTEHGRAATDWHAVTRTGETSGTGVMLRSDRSEVQVEYAARMVRCATRRLAAYVALSSQTAVDVDGSDAEAPTMLTAREREIVTLVALGEDTKGIARQLFISPETVKTHVRNAMAKLEVRTRAQLVAVALGRAGTLRMPRPT